MPDSIYQLLLPCYAALIATAILWKRALVLKRTGRDPVLIRPWRRQEDSLHGFLERALSLGTIALVGDVVLNAVWPCDVKEHLAVSVLRDVPLTGWSGIALVTLGILFSLSAVSAMGKSWRMGIDREAPGALVTTGLFRLVRHPIYSGMLLVTLGMVLVTADLFSIAAATAAWIGIPMQARLEEEFLLSLYPEEYGAYRARTGRFWPRR